MNILVLGGLGFLGRSCVKELKKSHNVFVIDRINKNDSEYFCVNLSDTEKIIQIIEENQIECILHFISTLIPSSDSSQYNIDVMENYFPTIRLLEYCSENYIRFVYFSSGGAVYGNQKEVFNEHTKREPVSFYGLSKLNFENLIEYYYKTAGLNYLIIRPSNPYGFGQNLYGKQGLIAIIIGKILNNEAIEIWGDGNAVKDYIYIDDFVYYVTKLISLSDAWNESYNIGVGIGISVNEVLEAFRENKIQLPEIKYINSKQTDVKRMVLDCTKIQELIPYKTKDIKEGIKNFYWKVINGE